MKRAMVALTLLLTAGGCTLNNQSAPSPTGPSELALSVSLTATPDAILMDGLAQSTVEILVRDTGNKPVSGQTFVVQTRGGGKLNVGSLSATSVSTTAQGRASVVFTAPTLGAGVFTDVTVEFTPVGTNASNGVTRSVHILMVR